jgi:hypothetical protein
MPTMMIDCTSKALSNLAPGQYAILKLRVSGESHELRPNSNITHT